LTKTTALGLVPFVLILIAFLAYRARSIGKFFLFSVSFFVPVLLLTGWWFLRNAMLYGDPLAYKLIAASALPPRDAPLTLPELTQINLPWLWQTFWGGPTPGDFPQILLALFLGAFVIALFGLVLYLTREWRALGAEPLLMLGLLLGWLAFIFIAQLQFIRTASGTDQGRYLFPAIASIALIYTLGWNETIWRVGARIRPAFDFVRAQRGVAIFVLGLFIALPLFVLVAKTYPAYASPRLFDPEMLGQRGAPISADFENGMELRGYALGSRSIACSDKLGVTLFWTTDRRMADTYRVFAHLVNAQGAVGGNKDVIPGGGAYPTVYWKPDEWLEDTIYVPVNHGARAGNYGVIVGVYKFGEPDQRVNLQNSEQDFVTLGDVQLNAPAEGCP
jgi:hypothetical protein